MLQLNLNFETEQFSLPITEHIMRLDWSIVASRFDENQAHLTVAVIEPDRHGTPTHRCLLENISLSNGQRFMFNLGVTRSTPAFVRLTSDPLAGLRDLIRRNQRQPLHPRYLADSALGTLFGRERLPVITPEPAASPAPALSPQTAGLVIETPDTLQTLEVQGDVWAVHCSGSWRRNEHPNAQQLLISSFPSLRDEQSTSRHWLQVQQPVVVEVKI